MPLASGAILDLASESSCDCFICSSRKAPLTFFSKQPLSVLKKTKAAPISGTLKSLA